MASSFPLKAVAVLRGEPGVSGVVTFTQNSAQEPTQIHAKIEGLKAGKWLMLVDGCIN